MLSSGVPTREEYLRLESEPTYGDLLEFSREFKRQCQAGSNSARDYSRKWVEDPFLQWSRRWEYVYVAQQLSKWLVSGPEAPSVADAGSGFTFFPYYLLQSHPDLTVNCLDNDPVAGEALRAASEILGGGPGFHIEDLEDLKQEDETVDVVYSVSVIEHTKHPRKVIDEIHRVLRPGGLFICTFDISFETRSPMHVTHVEGLVDHINNLFNPSSDWKSFQFGTLQTDETIVTTHWDSEAVRSGLPWRRPLLVWLYDMLRSRYRRSLYRPMTFCCVTVTKP